MDIKHIEQLYKNLISDQMFESLEVYAKEPNIFSILGISTKELKHSNILGWLFDPNGSHGLGTYFLKKFLIEVSIDSRVDDFSIVEISSLKLENARVKREWKHIDILIEIDQLVIVIENKIFSGEHKGQLSKYKKLIDDDDQYKSFKKLYIYLTPFGIESSENESYINISYGLIIQILETIIKSLIVSINPAVSLYIKDYINIIKTTIMETSEINNLALSIYKNHSDLINIIFENIPDEKSEYLNEIEKKLNDLDWVVGSKNKNCLRFLTKNLDELIPKGKNIELNKREAFVFQIFFPDNKKNDIKINSILYAADDEVLKILKPIMDALDKRTNKSKKYLTYQNKIYKIKDSLILNKEPAEIESEISKIIKIARNMVENVETSIITKKSELSELSNKRMQESF